MNTAVNRIMDTIEEDLYLYDIEFDKHNCDKLFELLYDMYLRNGKLDDYKDDMINFVKDSLAKNDYTLNIIKCDLFLNNLSYLNLSDRTINYIIEEVKNVKKK